MAVINRIDGGNPLLEPACWSPPQRAIVGAASSRDGHTGPPPGTRSRLSSLAIHGSLTSFSACFGVLRRCATHDARAGTPIPVLSDHRRVATGRKLLERRKT